MNKFDKEVQVFYDRFDKAYENNDLKELAFFSQFCIEKDIRKWTNGHYRRQICENARNNKYWLACGLTGAVLNEYGWHEWKIPGYEKQEFIPLGCIINRGCCNTKEERALGVMQLPNGKWIANVDSDFTSIGHPYIYLGIYDEQFDTRAKAVNDAIRRFVERWHRGNENVKKEDEAVRRAKSLIIADEDFIADTKKDFGKEPVQLELFSF
jgi:hypothetical protein